MKKLITLTSLSLSLIVGTAHAQGLGEPILKVPANSSQPAKSKNFVINESLGRAWVEVDLYHALSESSDHYRAIVPGLRYDNLSKSVVFENDGKRVVCATVNEIGWWLFKQNQVTSTGQCELSHRYIKSPVDNGFTIDHIEHFEVHFTPAT